MATKKAKAKKKAAKADPTDALKAIALELAASETWTGATMNRIAEIVTAAGVPIKRPPQVDPKLAIECPECGSTDVTTMKIRETYLAHHPVIGVDAATGVFKVQNALAAPNVREHFSEEGGDIHAVCEMCDHADDPARFGMGHRLSWEWV